MSEDLDPEGGALDEESVLRQLEGRLDDIAVRFGRTDWVELVAALVLAAATVLAAWSAYQSAQWGGVQAQATNRANAERLSALNAISVVETQIVIDGQTFTAWLQAAIAGDQRGMDEFAGRVREEARPAFDAWLASAAPGELPQGSPRDLPEYQQEALALFAIAEEATDQAAESMELAAEANQRSDNFVLVAVVMAAVLFFAGVGSKFGAQWIRATMVLLAALVLTVGFAFMLSMPQSFSI